MKKNAKVALWVAGLALAAYFAYRWWQHRQAGQDSSPTGSLGTNLNSVAPELVGGSSGPSVGPAVSMPLNITLSQPQPPSSVMPDNDHDGDMDSDDHEHRHHPIHRQRHAASVNPGGPMIDDFEGPPGDVDTDDDGSGDAELQPGGVVGNL